MKQLFLLLSLLFISNSFAGQGRDGGWPESIQLLRVAKLNLIELLKQATDQDVKDALNGMKDRNESIKPEEVNKDLLIKLINKLENPDVEKIENDSYAGIRLFFYDNNDPSNIRIYATKNFFALPKYQVKLSDLSSSLIKEVQTLILHEISHLWGFGEESGDINYARTFAVRMVNILHGSMKLSFTNEEKLKSLTQAFFHETQDIMEIQAEKIVNDVPFTCIKVTLNEEITDTKTFKFDPWAHTNDGYEVKDDSATFSARMTVDGYILMEATSWGFGGGIKSAYMEKKGANRGVFGEAVCHQKKVMTENYIDRFVKPYYTRSNFLTDLDNSSTVVYQSLLIQNMNFLYDTFKATMEVFTANQNQNVKNVDFKIKVENKEVYERVISKKYKYSKPHDEEDLKYLNTFINSDFSTGGEALYAQFLARVKGMGNTIQSMKNISRQIHMDQLIKSYVKEFNQIIDRTAAFEDAHKYSNLKCYNEKRVGKFYACQIEETKVLALSRLQVYEKMDVDAKALLKLYSNKAMDYKD